MGWGCDGGARGKKKNDPQEGSWTRLNGPSDDVAVFYWLIFWGFNFLA